MTPYHNGTSSIEEKGLRYKLMIIEGLVFVLPFFIISYIFYVNNIFLEFSQMFIFALILLIILTGLMTLRQIFDRFFAMTTLMKNAVNNNEYLVDIQKDTAELHEITLSFNNLMKKYENTTSELGHRVFELFAIKELTEVASKSLDMDELLNLLLVKATAVTKAQTGSVFMVESEKNRFRVVASKGLESYPEKGSYIKIDESLVRHVVWEKSPLLVQDIEADSRTRKQNDPKYGPPSFLSMPIFVRGDLLFVVNLSHKETGEVFDSNDQEILSIMIGEMGFALENAQLHLRVEDHLQDLQKRTVELTKANNQLKETRDMLIQSEKLAAIGQLTAGIAHEILNPINIMSIRLQILNESEDVSDPVKNTLNICKNQLDRISEITSNLGQFSRVPEKHVMMSNLEEIVDEILNMCAPQLKVEDVDKVVRYHSDLPLIPLDKDKFQQVILNIISNAVAAMSGQATRVLRIDVKPTPSGDSIQVIISDTGRGIDDSHINKVFDPFFTTKYPGKGVGLGLYISYGIIEEHSGKIWAENNEWGGASFFIEFPLGKEVSA